MKGELEENVTKPVQTKNKKRKKLLLELATIQQVPFSKMEDDQGLHC